MSKEKSSIISTTNMEAMLRKQMSILAYQDIYEKIKHVWEGDPKEEEENKKSY